eukprot:166039-Amphidinium_carterae.1
MSKFKSNFDRPVVENGVIVLQGEEKRNIATRGRALSKGSAQRAKTRKANNRQVRSLKTN